MSQDLLLRYGHADWRSQRMVSQEDDLLLTRGRMHTFNNGTLNVDLRKSVFPGYIQVVDDELSGIAGNYGRIFTYTAWFYDAPGGGIFYYPQQLPVGKNSKWHTGISAQPLRNFLRTFSIRENVNRIWDDPDSYTFKLNGVVANRTDTAIGGVIYDRTWSRDWGVGNNGYISLSAEIQYIPEESRPTAVRFYMYGGMELYLGSPTNVDGVDYWQGNIYIPPKKITVLVEYNGTPVIHFMIDFTAAVGIVSYHTGVSPVLSIDIETLSGSGFVTELDGSVIRAVKVTADEINVVTDSLLIEEFGEV